MAQPFPLLDLIETTTEAFAAYQSCLVGTRSGPYATQRPGGLWNTKTKPLSDPLIRAHLEQKYWVAARAAWYPPVWILDYDRPGPGDLERLVAALGLSESQYRVCTSPSYRRRGAVHILIRLSYRGAPPTQRLGYEALGNVLGRVVEIYPQVHRKIRLPLGRDQYVIGGDGRVLSHLVWQEALPLLLAIETTPIEGLTYQEPLPFPSRATVEDRESAWPSHGDLQALWVEGLQASGTRHRATWDLAVWLWRQNVMATDAARALRRWIRERHNGHSATAKRGDWRTIDSEIERIVEWVWTHFRVLPDSPHNGDAALVADDLRLAAELFPGDVVHQKRTVALLSYYRPRRHHGWVYIPRHVWSERVAGREYYQGFRRELEARGVLESCHSYRHVPLNPDLGYSKRYHLRVPLVSGDLLRRDERNVVDYYKAVLAVTGSVRGAVELTGGVAKQRFYEALTPRSR